MALISAVVSAIINEMPLLLVLLVIFVSGARRVWVWGRELARVEQQLTDERVDQMGRMHDLREERDQWRRIALMQSGRVAPEALPPAAEGD